MKLNDLMETPIADIKTIGNFDKAHSFRHESDRRLVTQAQHVERIIKKFNNVPQLFNLYFVNKPGAGKYRELGLVDDNAVNLMLGQDVFDILQKRDKDAITVIFTGNSADERMPLTPWIIAHRIGHAFNRGYPEAQNPYFKETGDQLVNNSAIILDDGYRYDSPADNMDNLSMRRFAPFGGDDDGWRDFRKNQLVFKSLWEGIGNFRSAKSGDLRDFFEMQYELLAQYITTGSISFRPLPEVIQAGPATSRTYLHLTKDKKKRKDVEDRLDSLGRDMGFGMDGALDFACGKIWLI